MKPCFLVNNLNKGKWVYRACAGALSQTIPCHVLLTDAQSTDNSWEEIQRAVREAPRGAKHEVTAIQSPMKGSNNFQSCSDHLMWAFEQTESEWVLQTSSDDYSLPMRAFYCMEAAERNNCSAIATTMYFEKENETRRDMMSGFPTESGYVSAGVGLAKLAYGSVIAGYRKSFVQKVGGFGPVTPDVFWGYLAALDRGFYVVANPQHVHVQHEDVNNLGFQGKLLGAQGNQEELARLNELNRFQLFQLYFQCKSAQQKFFPLAHAEDQQAAVQMMVDQACGWYMERVKLHQLGITPGVM